MSTKYEADHFLRSFLTQISFVGLKTFIRENDSIIDTCPGCGQPQTLHTTTKITKVKDLALIFWSLSITLQN